MKKLIIFAAIIACCVAAPTLHQDDVKTSLPRPSPINPAVTSDPKPAEKITVITDPKEVAKFKRESGNHPHEPVATHLTPTVAPAHHAEGHSHDEHHKQDHHNHEDHHDHKETQAHDEHHHRATREDNKKAVVASKPAELPPKQVASVTTAAPKKLVAPPAPVRSKTTPTSKRTRKAASSTPAPPTKKTAPAPTKKTTPVPAPPAKNTAPAPTKKTAPVPAPVPQKHRQKRDEATSTGVHHAVAAPLKLTDAEAHPTHVAQTSSVHLPKAEQSSAPVRHQHIGALFREAQTKELADAIRINNYPDLQGGHPATSSPLVGPSHTNLKGGHSATSLPIPSSTPASHINAKRDIPVPLVAKHQHPEESPKEDEKKDGEHLNKVEKPSEGNKDEKHNVEKKDDILVEDLSEKAPGNHRPQQHHQLPDSQEHHQQQFHHEFHPQHSVQHSHEDTQVPVVVPTSSTAATIEHPVIRHHPVPVAELFARPKQ